MLSPLSPSVAFKLSVDINPESRRLEIERAVPTMLPDLVTIISDFDTEPALKPFKTTGVGEIVDCEQNLEIGSAIAEAFISVQTDPRILRIVIENAIKGNYVPALSALLNEVRSRGNTIYLNHADLSNMTIIGLDLRRASAEHVDFSGSTLIDVHFDDATLFGADFTESVFMRSFLNNTLLQYVTMKNTQFYITKISGSPLEDDACGIRAIMYVKVSEGDDGELQTDYYLNGRHSFQPEPVPDNFRPTGVRAFWKNELSAA